MAKQEMTLSITQNSSGSVIYVKRTYTSDGVVVKRSSKRFSNQQEGATLDMALFEAAHLSIVARVTGWLQQTRMF